MARTKKEFNKEAMYKKIMPSMLRSSEENSENNKNDKEAVINLKNIEFVDEENIIDDKIDDEENNKLYDNKIDNEENNKLYDDNIEDIGYKNIDLNQKCNIIDKKEENIYLTEQTTVNFFEVIVTDKLDSVLKIFKCCKCKSCIDDIISVVLNNLPAYQFSGNKEEMDEALTEFKLSNNIDIVSEIIKAIISVRKKPKH